MNLLKQADSMTGFKLAVQDTRPKSLFLRIGQVLASPSLKRGSATSPDARTMG